MSEFNRDREEQIYEDALILMKSNDLNLVLSAVDYFNSISDYKDSAEKKAECLEKIKRIELRMERDRKYMKANIVIICMAMIAILSILIVFISAMIYQHNNVKEFTQADPVTAAQTTEVASESNSVAETEPVEESDTGSEEESQSDTEIIDE